jgi:hypothetical protein
LFLLTEKTESLFRLMKYFNRKGLNEYILVLSLLLLGNGLGRVTARLLDWGISIDFRRSVRKWKGCGPRDGWKHAGWQARRREFRAIRIANSVDLGGHRSRILGQ